MFKMFTGTQRFTINSMRSNHCFVVLFLCFFLVSCNVPSARKDIGIAPAATNAVLWNLNISAATAAKTDRDQITNTAENPTATPQLIKAVNFEEAFSHAQPSSDTAASQISRPLSSGSDRAEWLYFSPQEYTTNAFDTLYAAFRNTGDSTWTEAYYLEFYAGMNPTGKDRTELSKIVYPGDQASFEIPITKTDSSWKACWLLKNPAGESFYDFCYNHGSGVNAAQSAQTNNSGNSSGFDPSHPFHKTEGSAPARFSSAELSAELVSLDPASGHSFQAYDHYESLSAAFINNGTSSWDSSFSLVFYSGYNWMHVNSSPLSGNVAPGETAVFNMPMEIYEDNDRWFTCWYLAAPDGKNLADFCFNYFTG